MRKSRRRQQGTSLVEVLIGVVILAVGLLALAGLQVTSVRGNFFSGSLTQATYAAQDRMEFLRTLTFDAVPLQPGTYGDGTVTISGVAFDRACTVGWNDGTNHRVSLSTIRSQ